MCAQLKAERFGNVDLRDKQWLKLFYSNSAALILSKTCSFAINCEKYLFIDLFICVFIYF